MLEELKETLSKKIENDSKYAPARTLVVASGKGGVGKSFLALNLGLLLSQLGQKVLILDADLGLANVSLMANLNPKHTLEDLLKGECTLPEAITTYSNLHILPAACELSGFDILSVENTNKLDKLWPEIKKLYDFILIDTSAGVSPIGLFFFLGADQVLLVSTSQPTSIANSYALLKFILSKDSTEDVSLLWNMVSSQKEAYQLAEKFDLLCSTFLGKRIGNMDWVLNDEKVEKSIVGQIPLVIKYPFSTAASCLERIAFKLIDQRQKGKKSIYRFFSRAKAEVKKT